MELELHWMFVVRTFLHVKLSKNVFDEILKSQTYSSCFIKDLLKKNKTYDQQYCII
jgi:hypothetical protein